MPYGHEQIIERAVADVRNRYATAPDPDRRPAELFRHRYDLQWLGRA